MLTVYQADMFEIRLPNNSIDLVIASPPRSIVSNSFIDLVRWVDRCLSPSGVFVVDVPGLYAKHKQDIHCFNNRLNEKKEDCFSLQYRYCAALHDLYLPGELITAYLYSVEEIERYTIPFKTCNERIMQHRCEADAVYVQFLIESYSKRGDTVLDPFCGTGTVPRIAHKLKREAIGIDKRCPFTNEELP